MQLRIAVPVLLMIILITIASALMAWLLIASPHSLTSHHLLLDETGCVAAKHFGLTVTPIESEHACELVAEDDFEFNWVAPA